MCVHAYMYVHVYQSLQRGLSVILRTLGLHSLSRLSALPAVSRVLAWQLRKEGLQQAAITWPDLQYSSSVTHSNNKSMLEISLPSPPLSDDFTYNAYTSPV